eukprot:3609654-Rhodomonas_salina.2
MASSVNFQHIRPAGQESEMISWSKARGAGIKAHGQRSTSYSCGFRTRLYLQRPKSLRCCRIADMEPYTLDGSVKKTTFKPHQDVLGVGLGDTGGYLLDIRRP